MADDLYSLPTLLKTYELIDNIDTRNLNYSHPLLLNPKKNY